MSRSRGLISLGSTLKWRMNHVPGFGREALSVRNQERDPTLFVEAEHVSA